MHRFWRSPIDSELHAESRDNTVLTHTGIAQPSWKTLVNIFNACFSAIIWPVIPQSRLNDGLTEMANPGKMFGLGLAQHIKCTYQTKQYNAYHSESQIHCGPTPVICSTLLPFDLSIGSSFETFSLRPFSLRPFSLRRFRRCRHHRGRRGRLPCFASIGNSPFISRS